MYRAFVKNTPVKSSLRSALLKSASSARFAARPSQAGFHTRPTAASPSILPRSSLLGLRSSFPPLPLGRLASTFTPKDTDTVVNEEVLAHVEKANVKRVLVVGSGGLSIGQAGEFDYSGSQAIKALKESNIHTILVNPNIATIQTEHSLADTVYFLPVTPEYLEDIIEKERPDGILLTFGGQTALNCGIKLDQMGVFERLGVQVLGTSIRTLILSEDRDLFAQALKQIDIPVAESTAVESVKDALDAAERIGYPVIVRSAFSLGGLGSGFADDREALHNLATKSLALSPQILVEKSMRGWKEVEYEVVRDAANNCITVCNMENFDPLGVHTGDSIVVAPSQTLSDEEYHMLRTAAIKIVRHMGVVGECNVQYALNPHSLEYKVIEMNARLSRSSALASKATGYPLAFVAAKIALGHTLPELRNAVTRSTTANFEPSLDYIVTKMPRWDLSKFQHVGRDIGSQMKSVGEVMAIGRTFEESLQKAIRQVDPAYSGFQSLPIYTNASKEDLESAMKNPTDRRLFAVGAAMIDRGYTVDQVHEITRIDKWFLHKLARIVETGEKVKAAGSLPALPVPLLREAKERGYSDPQIAKSLGSTELEVRAKRQAEGIIPRVKRIDTLAAEFPAPTNYLYTTYNASTDDVSFDEHGTMVLGSGVYRIGSSVEFDWCGVSAARALRDIGRKTILVNYNPETVSTDFDECDRLYFEELSYERVRDIYEREAASGVVVGVGGQLPQNIALRLQDEAGLTVLGTNARQIDAAEDRYKFSQILDDIGVGQPEWRELTSVKEAQDFAAKVGYPVLVRPSYVLSGAAMNVAWDAPTLERHLGAAADVSPLHPVVVSKFIEGSQELDVDAVAHKGRVLVHAVSQHVEQAGVHSGDATLILPPSADEVPKSTLDKMRTIADKVAKAFEITGPFNMQVIRTLPKDGGPEELRVIECNLRASRSFPFVSKVLGVNFVDVATRAMCGEAVPESVDLMSIPRPSTAVKVAQFSWTRLQGADPRLGVEMSSTGEVASFGQDKYEAYLTALQSVGNFHLPRRSILLSRDALTDDADFAAVAQGFLSLGHPLITDTPQTAQWLKDQGVGSDDQITFVDFPFMDKRGMKKAYDDAQVDMVVSMARDRPATTDDRAYNIRRSAVDLGIPLVNDGKCARLFVEALAKYRERRGELKGQEIPSEVRSWREFITPSQSEHVCGVKEAR
ncbi:MAG: hypothetical protein DHS80DRAFT_27787 [Piptocephalis tieghemiana]|nr:MAG: hypothetical protein DHS80DRAFT_27787 [Piptocephalis tieghemiana]